MRAGKEKSPEVLEVSDFPGLDEQINVQVDRALASAGFYSAVLALVAFGVLVVIVVATRQMTFLLPIAFTALAAVLSLSIRRLAKRGQIRGTQGYVTMVLFTSLPSSLVLAGYVYGSGTASFITGPISYLYCFLIVISGFLFNPRFSILCGVLAGAQYFVLFLLGRESLAAIQTPHEVLHTDLSSPAVWINKSMMVAAVGLATAGIAVIARRLLVQTLREARLFGQYVSPEIRERIVAGASGQRVRAVVLFSDLCGFSTYSEGREPEEIVAQLNAYFDAMVECIRANGGLVDKFIGDAIMAVFEPNSGAAHPERAAVSAAHAMRSELRVLNERWYTSGVVPFDNGIGIHVGDVVQGPIGSADRKEWTVIGDAVNSAARIESLTRTHDCGIIITDVVYQALSAEMQQSFGSLGETAVKGKAEKLTIYGAK